jgi:glycerol uptake facilitator protein
MNPYLAEFIGTALLVLFGNGVVANVVLARTKGNSGGWIVITAGWGLAVFIGAFCAAPFSGAHLNPAVTLAMALTGKLATAKIAGYIVAQMLGGLAGAALVFFYYREHFKASTDADGKLACFCTAPNIRNIPQAFFCELVGTFCLILPIFLMTDVKFNGLSAPRQRKSRSVWAAWGWFQWHCSSSPLDSRWAAPPATRLTPRATSVPAWRMPFFPYLANATATGATRGCRSLPR